MNRHSLLALGPFARAVMRLKAEAEVKEKCGHLASRCVAPFRIG
jgi:hypothetical protein